MRNPSSYLSKKVRGVRRYLIYYDPDVFTEKIVLSASLLIGSSPEGFPDVPFNANIDELGANGITHYNSIHEEDTGESGTDFKVLDDLAISIYPKPASTKIVGAKKVEKGSNYSFYIDPNYDEFNNFTYDWQIQGAASFVSIDGKKTSLLFGQTDGVVVLLCKITNPAGCYRYIIKNIHVGIVTKEMLVIRSTYF